MFSKIAGFEFRYQLRQPVFWVVVLLFAFMAFATIAASNFINIGFGANVHKNAPYAIAITHFLFGVLYMFVTTAFVANVIVRDDDTGFGTIIRTTRINKFDYLFGRFTGAYAAAVVSFLAVPVGMIAGSLMPCVDKETLGPLNLADYVYPFVFIGMPALLVTSALFFALATATRSIMWTYVGVVGFLVLYFARGMLLSAPEYRPIAALVDPFGGTAYGLAARYWTVSEMNSQNPPIEGLVLWNKLIWLGVSAAFLTLAYAIFRFTTAPLRGRRLRAAKVAAHAPLPEPATVTGPLPKPVFNGSTARAQLWARTRLDMGQVFLSPAYFVLLIIGAAFAVFALWTVTDVGRYDGAIYPVTRVMLDRLTSSYTIIPLIIAIYYAGELVWRERERKINEIIDASAVPGWAFALPKVLAISLVLISTLLIGVGIALVIQMSKGYFDFELTKYLFWLVLPQAADFILVAVLAIFIQTFSPNKFVGWAIMVVFLIAQGTAASFGWDQNLYIYGGTPLTPLSDLNGQGHFWIGAAWFRLYWALFAVVLLALTHAVWQRGIDARLLPRLRALPGRLGGAPGRIMAVSLVAFAITGGWIYLNTNVWNEHRTLRGDQAWLGDYEKALYKYLDTPRPKIVSMKLAVDLYPDSPRAVTHGEYVVENRTGEVLKEIHLAFDRDLKVSGLTVEGGRPAAQQPEARFNYRIFALDDPMLPGDRRVIAFTTERSQRGFRNSGDETRIVPNGTFINNTDVAPLLGFERSGVLQDRARRRELGLPDREPMPHLGDVPSRQSNYLRHDADFVLSDIAITTRADQTPIAPGQKVSDVIEGDRRTVRFVTEAPVLPFFSIQSARYAVASKTYKGVNLDVFYDPHHPWNVGRMQRGAEAALDYYQANFSPYQFKQLRFVEFPAYADFAQAFAGTMPWSEGLGFIARLDDPSKIDLITYVGAHEIGHQWWAHQIIGADQQGRTLLSETLAQYSALMVMRHMYGEDQIRRFLKLELDGYLRSRGGELRDEKPIYRVEDQDYIHYRKGSLVMYRLQREIGEEAVNRALRSLLAKFAFKGAPYPTSLDLVAALRAEAPADKQGLITDLFEKITLYDLKTKAMTVTKRKDGRYDVVLTVEAKKLYADGKGRETAAPMAEVLDVGLFTAMPGDKGFDSGKVVTLVRRPIHTGTQTLTFTVDKAPKYGGVDPYNYLIDRNSDDNVLKAG
ncbi:MAG: M1 family aminopeptidase [Caulobacter sp.]